MQHRRLISLLGPGGVGKTRLAFEAGRAQVHNTLFADGIWLVELASLTDRSLVTTAIAGLLGVREQSKEPLVDTLVSAIGGKRLLLILDNCEHVIDECALVVERLTRYCSGVNILATTREPLRIDGECSLRVEPLAIDDSQVTAPALSLLIDRLIDTDVTRFSTMTSEDRAHALTICKRLDGIPLALELAASRARDFSLNEIAAGLDARFSLLNQGHRTALPRHQTLEGMIDWSFALLTPHEQRLFARLGLFGESFSPDAVANICGEDPAATRDALVGLIAKSLIAVVEDREGRLRYRLLETMRMYALDRLGQAGERDRYAHRFAQYFCDVAKQADSLYGRISNKEFLALSQPDLSNFREALGWTLGQKNDTVLGAELAGAMGWQYRQLSLFSEGTRWCEQALAENGDLHAALRGRLYMALSFFFFNMGEISRALEAADSATQSYRKAQRRSELSWALTQRAYCLYLLGRSQESREAVASAVAIARAQQDTFRLAGALNAFALTIPAERAAERLAPLEEAIACYRASGDESAVVSIANVAEAYYATGDFHAALARGVEVVAITRKNLDYSNLSGALANVAAYALAVGDDNRAQQAAHEALQLGRDIGKTMNAMCVLQHLGSVAARRGDPIKAARLFGASNRLYREFGLSREFTEESLYTLTLEEVRSAIGDEALRQRLEEGESLPFERAVDEGLAIH